MYLLACQVNRWELTWSFRVFGTSQVSSEHYLPWPCLFQPWTYFFEKLGFELITMRMPLPFNHSFFSSVFFLFCQWSKCGWYLNSVTWGREKPKGGGSNFGQMWRYARPANPILTTPTQYGAHSSTMISAAIWQPNDGNCHLWGNSVFCFFHQRVVFNQNSVKQNWFRLFQ